jgi:hypothetical protein
MKKIALLLLAGSLYASSFFGQGWQWRKAETQSNIIKDQNNDLYILASTSSGVTIKKRDLNGNILWSKSLSGGAKVNSYKIDGANNLVLLGNVTTTATIDNNTLVSKSASNFFILKMSSASSVLSVNVYGNTGEVSANDLFINSSGEYLIGGSYKGSFNMNGTLITGDTVFNFFVVKTNPSQNVLWWEANGYVPGAKGSTWIDELVETNSGNICLVYSTTGLVDYKGQQNSVDGQFMVELDPGRNLLWSKYLCYPFMGYDFYSNLTAIGDSVYMKNVVRFNHSGPAAYINKWTPTGTGSSKQMGGDEHYAYNIFNNRIYFASIRPTDPYYTAFYRQIGFLYSNLSNGVSDSAAFPQSNWPSNYYSEIDCIDPSRYYIGGKDSTLGTFVGLFDMNNMPMSVAEKTKIESSIFPNPSTGIVNITGIPSNTSVKVYNSNGCEVKCSLKDSQIDLSTQPSGIYLMELSDGDRRVTKKIVLE